MKTKTSSENQTVVAQLASWNLRKSAPNGATINWRARSAGESRQIYRPKLDRLTSQFSKVKSRVSLNGCISVRVNEKPSGDGGLS